MRSFWTFMLFTTSALTAGCSAPPAPAHAGAVTAPAVGANPASSPNASTANAAAVAQRLLASGTGFTWVESPRAVRAEQLSYAEANDRIGISEPQFDLWPADTRVWLVILEGRWLLTPMGPTQVTPQPIQYAGCLFALFTAADEKMLAAGDAVCPTGQ